MYGKRFLFTREFVVEFFEPISSFEKKIISLKILKLLKLTFWNLKTLKTLSSAYFSDFWKKDGIVVLWLFFFLQTFSSF